MCCELRQVDPGGVIVDLSESTRSRRWVKKGTIKEWQEDVQQERRMMA